LYLPRIGQVENMSVEGLFVHGGDLWRLNTPLSCLQPPQQGKTHLYTVVSISRSQCAGQKNIAKSGDGTKNRIESCGEEKCRSV
ncbi:hypothetical protein, partial [Escherichia coli]|uniref:hypothetical protein n=1 Tax=Escherichia coli TaxID=562 RepID=UPI001BC88568